MRYFQLFGKTVRQAPRDEVSVNAKLLIRAGFIRKEVAGVYNFLPLGFRVLNKISQIVREEMNAAGGQEVLLSALQNSINWQKTGRWKNLDVLFKVKSQYRYEYALGPTHEEVLVPIAKEFVRSWRDLPQYLYQIQVKFRDEPRAKAGLLRGREFLMKDLYSFHTDEKGMRIFYEKMKQVYTKTFTRMGLKTIETEASGGTFSKFSHEYQVLCQNGEDTIFYCNMCDFAQNKEIAALNENTKCPKCHQGKIKVARSIEVGNIFPLKDKYSKALDLKFVDRDGMEKYVVMGCYGIGITRAMGAIAEVFHDDAGIIWPEQVAPFRAHLLVISDESRVMSQAKEIYQKLLKADIEVLFDDRMEVSAGEKFADCDLIGIPYRLVISDKTLQQVSGRAGKGKVEYKARDSQKIEILTTDQVLRKLKS